MYNQYYSKEEQYLFTDRISVLQELKYNIDQIKKGGNKKLSVLGPRRIGKTITLLELIKRNFSDDDTRFCYINLQNTVLMPSLFAKQYVANILYWLLNDSNLNIAELEDLNKMEKKRKRDNFPYSEEINIRIFQLTQGHPFYVYLLSEVINQYHKIYNLEIDVDIIDKIFIKELINPRSTLYNHLNYLFEHSLEYAQGSNLLRAVLKILAASDQQRITDLAKKIYRERSEIKIALGQLEKVDLVVSENKMYSIKDKVLRFWLKNYFGNINVELDLDNIVLSNLVEEFKEKYLQVSRELGLTKELELKSLIEKTKNREIVLADKRYIIPNFKKIDEFKTRKTQVDLVAENDEKWAFELKWRNEIIGLDEIKKFLQKVAADKYVVISKSGFTKETLEFRDSKEDLILWDKDIFDINLTKGSNRK